MGLEGLEETNEQVGRWAKPPKTEDSCSTLSAWIYDLCDSVAIAGFRLLAGTIGPCSYRRRPRAAPRRLSTADCTEQGPPPQWCRT